MIQGQKKSLLRRVSVLCFSGKLNDRVGIAGNESDLKDKAQNFTNELKSGYGWGVGIIILQYFTVVAF